MAYISAPFPGMVVLQLDEKLPAYVGVEDLLAADQDLGSFRVWWHRFGHGIRLLGLINECADGLWAALRSGRAR